MCSFTKRSLRTKLSYQLQCVSRRQDKHKSLDGYFDFMLFVWPFFFIEQTTPLDFSFHMLLFVILSHPKHDSGYCRFLDLSAMFI